MTVHDEAALTDEDGAAYVTSATVGCDAKENAAALDANKDVAVTGSRTRPAHTRGRAARNN